MGNNKENIELGQWAKDGLEAYEKHSSLEDLESRLENKFESQFLGPMANEKRPRFKILRMLVPLTAVAVVLILLWPSTNNPSSIFIEHYQELPEIFDIAQRGNQKEDNKKELRNGITAYHAGQYPQVIETFNGLDTQNDLSLLYLGLSYLATENSIKSIEHLEKVSNVEYEDVKQWYLALAYLQSNDSKNSIKHLQIIVNNQSHYKKAEAVTMLARLR